MLCIYVLHIGTTEVIILNVQNQCQGSRRWRVVRFESFYLFISNRNNIRCFARRCDCYGRSRFEYTRAEHQNDHRLQTTFLYRTHTYFQTYAIYVCDVEKNSRKSTPRQYMRQRVEKVDLKRRMSFSKSVCIMFALRSVNISLNDCITFLLLFNLSFLFGPTVPLYEYVAWTFLRLISSLSVRFYVDFAFANTACLTCVHYNARFIYLYIFTLFTRSSAFGCVFFALISIFDILLH